MKRVQGRCTFETISADELLQAVESLSCQESLGVDYGSSPRGQPRRQTCFLGSLPFRAFFAPEAGLMIHFQGWPDTERRLILAPFLDPPWLGIIEPTVEDHALVRHVCLNDAPPGLSGEMVAKLAGQAPVAEEYHDVPFWKALARQVGFVEAEKSSARFESTKLEKTCKNRGKYLR